MSTWAARRNIFHPFAPRSKALAIKDKTIRE